MVFVLPDNPNAVQPTAKVPLGKGGWRNARTSDMLTGVRATEENRPIEEGEHVMHEKSIALLNRAVADELSAVHQYMYFHFHCDDQGYDLLAGLFKRTAIEEMIHVERLAERILFLKGDVEMVTADAVQTIHEVDKMLQCARGMEEESARQYNQWANECGTNADSVSKKLFEDLVADEERHYDQYDTELENMAKFGDRYLALQSIERARNRAAGTPAD
jgi:bacterioferritin